MNNARTAKTNREPCKPLLRWPVNAAQVVDMECENKGMAIPEGLKQSCGIMALRRKPATRAPFDPKGIFRGAVNPAPVAARVFRAAQETMTKG